MTEQEWLTSDDPRAMLAFATQRDVVERTPCIEGVSDRKLRLFACAAARLYPGLAAERDGELLRNVEACESWADGGAAPGPLWTWATSDAALAAREMARPRNGAAYGRNDVPQSAFAALLREVVGNPFRPVTLPRVFAGTHGAMMPDGRWVRTLPDGRYGPADECPWLTPDVLAVAQAVYEDRDFALLPVLADALEEAGCDDELLLRHLRGWRPCYYCADNPAIDRAGNEWCTYCGHERWLDGDFGPGPHVLGCWALDLILGKE